MPQDRAELRLVRESLEAVVAPNVVSAVMLEALAHTGGELPAGREAIATLVDGPLRAALRARLGDDADEAIDGVLRTIAAVTPPEPSRRHADITREVVLDASPVLVSVVASSAVFAAQLQAALGQQRVHAVAAPGLEALRAQADVAPPGIVLVDAADFAAIEPEQLAAALAALPATTVRAIWGADLPYGSAVLRALVAHGAPATPLDRREGIEPLLDLIRSRRAG